MKINKKGFSLVIAMILVLVSSLLAYTILEYMVPFSRNISGIENATKSYYLANSAIERGLFYFSTREDKYMKKDINLYCLKSGCDSCLKPGCDKSYYKDYKEPNTRTGSSLETFSVSNKLPRSGEGDSDYDKNRNTISIGNPLQMSIGFGFLGNINNLKITFRTPEINGSSASLKTGDYISWQLVGSGSTLFSTTGSLIKNRDINRGNDLSPNNFLGYYFKDGNKKNSNLLPFFNNIIECQNADNECILKFSVIRKLTTINTLTTIPYLEWHVSSGAGNEMPLRYSIIDAEGKSNGYARKLKIRYPQTTVNQVFDFGVMQ